MNSFLDCRVIGHSRLETSIVIPEVVDSKVEWDSIIKKLGLNNISPVDFEKRKVIVLSKPSIATSSDLLGLSKAYYYGPNTCIIECLCLTPTRNSFYETKKKLMVLFLSIPKEMRCAVKLPSVNNFIEITDVSVQEALIAFDANKTTASQLRKIVDDRTQDAIHRAAGPNLSI